MAAGSFVRVYVKCPFYRYDKQDLKKITCEGVAPNSTISQVWKNKKGFATQIEQVCCDNYEECPIYKLLMQEKYPE